VRLILPGLPTVNRLWEITLERMASSLALQAGVAHEPRMSL